MGNSILLTNGILYASNGELLQNTINAHDEYVLNALAMDALQANNGHSLWHYPTDQHTFIHSLVSQGSTLYLLTAPTFAINNPNTTLIALQGTNGKTLWQQPMHAFALLLDGNSLYAGLAGNSGSPCAPKNDDQLTKFEADNGSQLWHKRLQNTPASP